METRLIFLPVPADPPAIDADEIIPPGAPDPARKAPRSHPHSISAVLAHLLDNLFKIPGLGTRFGLDSILSLIPGVGGILSSVVGSVIIAEGAQKRLPVRLLARMVGNLGINSLLDMIPFAGSVLSIWFRSNQRNNELLQHHLKGHPNPPGTLQGRTLLAFIIGIPILCLLFYIGIAAGVYLTFRHLFGGH